MELNQFISPTELNAQLQSTGLTIASAPKDISKTERKLIKKLVFALTQQVMTFLTYKTITCYASSSDGKMRVGELRVSSYRSIFPNIYNMAFLVLSLPDNSLDGLNLYARTDAMKAFGMQLQVTHPPKNLVSLRADVDQLFWLDVPNGNNEGARRLLSDNLLTALMTLRISLPTSSLLAATIYPRIYVRGSMLTIATQVSLSQVQTLPFFIEAIKTFSTQ